MSPIPPISATASQAQPDDRQDTVSTDTAAADGSDYTDLSTDARNSNGVGSGGFLADFFGKAFWTRTLFLATRFPLGLLWFLAFVILSSVGAATMIIGVGFLLLATLFFVFRTSARFERDMIKIFGGPTIADPYRTVPASGPPPGVGKRWRARLRDPASYRDALYLLLQFPFGLASFIVIVVGFSSTFGAMALPLFYNRMGAVELSFGSSSGGDGWFVVDRLWKALLVALIGLVLLPLLPVLVRLMSAIHFGLASLLLGPTRRTEVAEAIEQRDLGLSADMTERRRIERDLHDGAQQRLVAMTMELGRAKAKLDDDPDSARDLLDSAHDHAKAAMQELRDLARGIAPPLLSDRGLDAALSALAGRSPIPVDLVVDLNRRLAESVESAAYFVIAEASTNAIKHSGATLITVRVMDHGLRLAISVSDNGSGGVDPTGSGLVGLADRVRSVGGQFIAHDTTDGGAVITAEIPCES
jgi:signal transduction histidine kinase